MRSFRSDRAAWVAALCLFAVLGAEVSLAQGRNSAEAKINNLIANGQFHEAEAMIAEAAESKLIEQGAAVAFRARIADLAKKLVEVPARHQLEKMLERRDFSLATKKEIQTALKLLKEAERLMEKIP